MPHTYVCACHVRTAPPIATKLCPATGRMATSACAKFRRPAPTPWTRYGGDGRRRRRCRRRRRRRTHNFKFNFKTRKLDEFNYTIT